MTRALDVLVVSPDPLLSELLCGLFHQEGLCAAQVDSARSLRTETLDAVSKVVLFDLTDEAGAEVFREVLPDPEWALSGTTPAMLALAGSATPADLLDYEGFDRILSAPFQATEVLQTVQYYLDVRPRRARRSGVQVRLQADGTLPLPGRLPDFEVG